MRLKSLQLNSKRKIIFDIETLKLKEFDADFNIDDIEVEDNEIVRKQVENTNKINLTFMSARTCNMNCVYCFAGEGEYGNDSTKPKIMSAETYIDAFDFFVNKGLEIASVGFFGGEPLLGFSEIRKFITLLRERSNTNSTKLPEFGISTNGLLVSEEILEFCLESHIKLGFSLDGVKSVHDRSRFRIDQYGKKVSVYNEVKNICELAKKRGHKYTIQFTITKDYFMKNTFTSLLAGFQVIEKLDPLFIVTIPVTHSGLEASLGNPIQMERFDTQVRALVRYNLNKLLHGETVLGLQFVSPFMKIARREYTDECTAGRSVFVDTNADIYPCHIICNVEKYKIGNIYTGKLDKNIGEQFTSCTKDNNSNCTHCISKKVCFVWCPGMQAFTNNDISQIIPLRCVFMTIITEESIFFLNSVRNDKVKMAALWRNYKHNVKRL